MSTLECLFIGGMADGEVRAVPLDEKGNPPSQHWIQVSRSSIRFGEASAPIHLTREAECYVGERVRDKDGSEWIVYCYGGTGKSPLRMLIEGYRRMPGDRQKIHRRQR